MSLTIGSERLTGGTGGIADVYPSARAPFPSTRALEAPRPPSRGLTAAPAPRNALAGLSSAALSGLSRLLPDGYGVTIRFRGQTDARAFRDYAAAERAIATAAPGSVTSVVLYGHGAPGMLAIGSTHLDADQVRRLLAGKLAANARVTLYGCNTASIGDAGLTRNLAETSFFGLSSLVRRIAYFGIPVLSGADRATMEAMWDEDMARDVSRALPDAEVVGFRTYAFPADRLVPGSRNATPSEHVLARAVTYKNGEIVTGARRAR